MQRYLLALALFAAPAFAASEDEAGDVSEVDKDSAGPLRERVRPVSGHLFLMDGRFEVSPGIGISLRDALSRMSCAISDATARLAAALEL